MKKHIILIGGMFGGIMSLVYFMSVLGIISSGGKISGFFKITHGPIIYGIVDRCHLFFADLGLIYREDTFSFFFLASLIFILIGVVLGMLVSFFIYLWKRGRGWHAKKRFF